MKNNDPTLFRKLCGAVYNNLDNNEILKLAIEAERYYGLEPIQSMRNEYGQTLWNVAEVVDNEYTLSNKLYTELLNDLVKRGLIFDFKPESKDSTVELGGESLSEGE